MSEQTEILVVHSDQLSSQSIADELSRTAGAESRVMEKHNLDGSPAGWFIVVIVAIKTLPAILDAIGRLIDRHRVKSIKLGELQLENPTRADIDELKLSYLPRTSFSDE